MRPLLVACLALLAASAAVATELNLSASAAREVENDRFVAALAGRTTATDTVAAQAALDRLMQQALATLADVEALSIETRGYAVRPERPDDGPERWIAEQTLALESGEREALVAAVDALQPLGLAVRHLGARLSEARAAAARAELVRAAAAELEADAARTAAAFGLEFAGWTRLDLDGARPAPRAAMMQAAAADSPPALIAGRTTVRVKVDGTAELRAPATP